LVYFRQVHRRQNKTRRASEEAIANAHAEQNATEERLNNTLQAIDEESKARREAIEAQKKGTEEGVATAAAGNEAIIENEKETQDEIVAIKENGIKEQVKTLSNRLNELPLSEKQIQNQQIKQFEIFLKQRAELEEALGAERISWLREQRELLLAEESLTGEEKIELQKAVNALILEEDKKINTEEQKLLSERLNNIPLTQEQILNIQIQQFKNFLKQRGDLQLQDNDNRIAWLQEQGTLLSDLETLSNAERIAAQKAVNELIREEDERLNKERGGLLEEHIASLTERLNNIPLSEKQIQNQQIKQFQDFLNQRAALEDTTGGERVVWLQKQGRALLAQESLTGEEKIALEKAINALILEEDKKLNVEEQKVLSERLNKIPLSEKQIQNQQIKQFQDFLNQRAALEETAGEERISWLREQGQVLLAQESLTGEEKIALQKALNALILEEDKKLNTEEQKLLSERLNNIPLTQEQILNTQIQQFKNFLKQRGDLQLQDNDNRIAWLQEQGALLSNLETLSNEERIAAQKAVNELILEEDKHLKDEQGELLEEHIASLTERLQEIPLNEQQIQTRQMEQFEAFLDERMELEKLKEEEKREWLEEQQELLLELETLNGDERAALEQTINDKIYKSDEDLKKKQAALAQAQMQGLNQFFTGVADLAAEGMKTNLSLLAIERAAASAQAAINTYVAFTSALKDVPYPLNFAAAAGVLASGLAMQIKIISTAIPSAETGGRFIVPNSVGSDSTLMRVNSGEEVAITPRGMTGTGNGGTQNILVYLEKQVLFDVVNDGIRSGDVYISTANF
jgi:protein tyrosine phosphatase (PTP) superfamily phosphohydrolase (DUF442 family)